MHDGPGALKRLRIGELWVDALDFQESLEAVTRLVEARRGGMVFTPNVDHVVLAEQHPTFRDAYARCDLSLADGMPIVWASKVLGMPLKERVSGADIILPLLERAGQRGWRVYFLGAGPGVAEEAAEIVRQRYGTNVVGCDAPSISVEPRPDDEARVLEKLRATKPDVVLVAFGAPKQEVWMARMRDGFSPAVALGIGAGLDFIAGKVPRAPVWVQRLGFEWFYRLSREPKRLWRRYLVQDPKFAAILLRTLRRPARERLTGLA